MASLIDCGLIDKKARPGDAAKPTKLHGWRVMVQRGLDRPSIRFRATPIDAQRFHERLEMLIAYGKPTADLVDWLGSLDDEKHAWIVGLGLAQPRHGEPQETGTLDTFTEKFLARMATKASTKTCYGHVCRNLKDCFGPDKPMLDITAEAADEFVAWLKEHQQKDADGKITTKRLSPATVSRRIIMVRTMWTKAVRWGTATTNPFTGIKAGEQVNDARTVFVPRNVIAAVMEHAPDTEWKVIIALSRYAGLRCPSEHFALRWGDVDFENNRMTIHSAKTERHPGKAKRVAPLFAELRPLLLALFDEAPEGTEYVISKHRLGGLNLRQQFERIIARAGVDQWPRLFHNLRGSCETELMRQYDLKTVCKWIGNSPAVAAKHYAMSQDLNADFQRAAGLVDGPKVGANLVQQASVRACTPRGGQNAPLQNRTAKPGDAEKCRHMQKTGMGAVGFEPTKA